MRLKAIYNSLKYGILPWWLYERTPHYDCSYWEHLIINLKYAIRWMTYNENQGDIDFEKSINKSFK